MRKFINQLRDNESFSEIYQIGDKQLRSNKNGKLYIQFSLCDRTGTLDARLWNATEEMFTGIESGECLRFEGVVQRFQGSLQIVVRGFAKVDEEEINRDDFIRATSLDIETATRRIREILNTVRKPELLNLIECYLSDREFMNRFCASPAGIRLHHAYRGGLLEHTLTMMEIALKVAPLYGTAIDQDMLLTAIFLHDTGKIRELSGNDIFVYSDEGQLLGHPMLAIELLLKKIAETEVLTREPFDPKITMILKHLLISHHGTLENGSTKLPMTIEAIALHYIDSLDAKVAEFQKHILDDPGVGNGWTNFIPTLDRKIYKG